MLVGIVATASAAVTEPGSFKNYLDVFFVDGKRYWWKFGDGFNHDVFRI